MYIIIGIRIVLDTGLIRKQVKFMELKYIYVYTLVYMQIHMYIKLLVAVLYRVFLLNSINVTS